jgi:uracil-DNA glycosylase
MDEEVFEIVFDTWVKPLYNLLKTDYFYRLTDFIGKSYDKTTVYPNKKYIFKAFKECPYKDLKIVILGKDPYPDGSATGLAFANSDLKMGDSKLSPSLKVIKDCIENSIYDGLNLDFDQTLTSWSKQGVLLLNTALTVERHIIGSHHKYWQKFTSEVLKIINDNNSGIIFMLWGKEAQMYEDYISLTRHYVLKCNHPSWAARNNISWDCNHFVKANELIEKNNGKEYCIKW